jgi:RNA-binding protein
MQRLARTIARLLDLGPDKEVRVSLTSPELRTALDSLVSASGATFVEDVIAPTGLVEIAGPPAPLVPAEARELIQGVVPGGVVVIVVHGATENAAALAHRLGPVFDLGHVHGEASPEVDDTTVVLRGTRRPAPTRERIKELRGIAHALEASILIGRDGLSAGLVESAREALARHGLVKAKLTPRARLDKDDSAVDLAWAAGGQLIQRVGKTAVIYRPDVPFQPPTMKHLFAPEAPAPKKPSGATRTHKRAARPRKPRAGSKA